jgi:hypothetical protein
MPGQMPLFVQEPLGNSTELLQQVLALPVEVQVY